MSHLDTRRVEIELAGLGEHAPRVQAWLRERYEHMRPAAWDGDGLCVSLSVPVESYDSIRSWHGRIHEATGSLDVALEVLAECLEALELDPARIRCLWLRGPRG